MGGPLRGLTGASAEQSVGGELESVIHSGHRPGLAAAIHERGVLAAAAAEAGITISRGLRTVAATDGLISMRAGYPTGMPTTGYVPLAALLRRRICDDEITAVTSQLMTAGYWPIGTADIGVAITRITNEMPSPDDIEREAERVAVEERP